MNVEAIKPKIAEIASKYGLDLVVLFGSQADGTATSKSDVDIAYSSKTKMEFDDEMNFGMEISTLFRSDLYHVVYLNSASPVFMYEIMKKAKVLYSRNRVTFPSFYVYSIKRLRENMRLYDLKFERLCSTFGLS